LIAALLQINSVWSFNPIANSQAGNAPLGTVVAFPGAEGGGANSVGGRGGTVYEVTNLNNAGTGSLRVCIDASGPRTCVFRTGGTISLSSTLTITNPYITIAGQTAPGGGIQLAGPSGAQAAGYPSLMVKTHNVVVRYLRIRRGHNTGEVCNQNPWSCGMSLEVLANTASDNAYNIVFDHVSAQWSNYDALGIVGHPNAGTVPHSITVSSSIIGEELGAAGQTTAAVVGGYSGLGNGYLDLESDIDFHHNLFAGSSHRMPLTANYSSRLVNNLVYGWTYYPMRSKGLRDFVNNYFTYRSGQSFVSHEIQAWTTNDGNDTTFAPSFYVSGNLGPSDPNGAANWTMTALSVNQSGSEASSPLSTTYQRSSPIPTPAGYIPITAEPASSISSATGSILNIPRTATYAGAGASRSLDCSGNWVDARDSVDTRITNAVVNGTTLFGSFTYGSLAASPQSQADLGGWPTLAAGTPCADTDHDGMPDTWEAANGLQSSNAADGILTAANGYTNLENYLNGEIVDPPAPDFTAPLISAVLDVNTQSYSTDITWTTDEPSDSQVIFIDGPCPKTTDCVTPVFTRLITSHSVSISGLTLSTTYNYQVSSKDPSGNVATVGPFSFNTLGDVNAPAVNMTSPANQAVVSGNAVTVSATATDDVGVIGLQFKLDGNNLGVADADVPYAISWNTLEATNGPHAISVVATDAAGNSIAASITVNVNNDLVSPAVSITAPANNAAVAGTGVSVTASASDNVGVVGVQFGFDGSTIGVEDTTAPFSVSWNTITTNNGVHTLSATARDAFGNTAVSTITVRVANPKTYSPSAYTVSLGAYQSGSMTSLTADDNNYFVVGSTQSGTRRTSTDYEILNVISASRLDYSIRLRSSTSSTAVTIYAYNFATSTWTQIKSISVGSSETTQSASITSSVSSHINNGRILVRVQSTRSNNHTISNEFMKVTATP
jgi:Big-like domain-containing protein